MKLLTKETIAKFESYPFNSQDGRGLDAEVLVKYFNPCGAGTWLISEAVRIFDPAARHPSPLNSRSPARMPPGTARVLRRSASELGGRGRAV